ncbi:MAG TPA: hypothetical protein V6D09_02345 [Leptolyngbyaceae cyanobacterium]
MHCTAKKTTQLIIEGGNDYILTVKDNQPRLLAQLETLAKQTQPEDRFVDVEKKRGRITCRIVNVFTDLSGIDKDWVGQQKFDLCRAHRHPAGKTLSANQLLY